MFNRFFKDALKFHAEGLAPVRDEKGWFHITAKGNDLYAKRYDRTFGYYFERSAVIEKGNWFHLDIQGNRTYSENYQWCGNYQQKVLYG